MNRWIATILVSIVTLSAVAYWFFSNYRFDLTAIWQMQPMYLLLGFTMAALDLSARAYRIVMVARQVDEVVSFGRCLRIILAVDFFAAITPSRIGGEVARIVGLKRSGLSTSKTVAVVGTEALMDVGYMVLALPLFLFCSATIDSNVLKLIRTAIAMVALALGVVTMLVLSKREVLENIFKFIQKHLPLMHKLLTGFGRWDVVNAIDHFCELVKQIIKGPKWLLPAGILLTMFWWVMRFGALFWISKGLGFSLSLSETFWPQFLIWNSMIYVPVPVSGGLFEAGFLLLYKDMVPKAIVPSVLVLWRFFTYYIFIIGGGVFSANKMWQVVVDRLRKRLN